MPALPRRTTLLAAGLGLAATLLPVGGAAQSSEPTAPQTSGLRLHVPERAEAERYGRRVWMQLGLRVVATERFELWSQRSSYDEPIRSEWRGDAGSVSLPDGVLRNFRGLPGFLRLRFTDRHGETVLSRNAAVCLNGAGERVRPDGADRSPYPWGCPWHPLTLGSVMGIPQGWAVQVEPFQRGQRLALGRYTVEVEIAPRYRTLFAIADEDATGTLRLRVREPRERHGGPHPLDEVPHHREGAAGTADLAPADAAPTGPETAAPTGPLPDLRSLPAHDLQISRNGNFLQFAATVWNAGESPLVVDGFRRPRADVMDAYQYFYGADGEQTGYTQVGEMEWDDRDSHDHWHFRDFARYRLLDENLAHVARSRKEAFCLANTDAVDYTVAGANWRPDGTDLHTACGDRSSLAVREVLDAGSGDTYAQFRAGQSFRLVGLPNGVYYVAVEANPLHRLVESDQDNNQALRRLVLGGTEGARTVEVFPVGRVEVG